MFAALLLKLTAAPVFESATLIVLKASFVTTKVELPNPVAPGMFELVQVSPPVRVSV